jgi:hypothetical protein
MVAYNGYSIDEGSMFLVWAGVRVMMINATFNIV